MNRDLRASRNRLGNVHNQYQNIEKHKRVLCICSAAILRSPTAAFVLSQEPYNYNTRAAGIDSNYALIPVDQALLEWADEVVVMEAYQSHMVEELITKLDGDPTNFDIKCLNIEDNYAYRDPELIRLIKERHG